MSPQPKGEGYIVFGADQVRVCVASLQCISSEPVNEQICIDTFLRGPKELIRFC